MAGNKYLTQVSGTLTEVVSSQSSAGAGDAGKIPALDAAGRLDNSMMPVGIGADTQVIVASEALAAGDWVNIWTSTGTKVRKADATVAGKHAMGFVLAAVLNTGNATVYFEGTNNQVTGQTAGDVFLTTTAGTGGSAPPSGSGNVVQRVGYGVSATAVNADFGAPIVLA